MINNICNLSLCLLALAATLSELSQAFVSPNNVMNNRLSSSFSITESLSLSSSSVLWAKKKRRRKQNQNVDSPPQPTTSSPTDELPDFELEEEREEKPKKKKPVASLDEITPEMMGAPGKPSRSISELIKDRALESKFEFDDDEGGDVAIPDFTQVARQSSQTESQPRGTLRKTKKIGVVDTKEEDSNPFENIEFIKDEKGNFSIVKILEAGAWLGIFLLVGWEVYINTPFFDRAAPLAPVVYEFYL